MLGKSNDNAGYSKTGKKLPGAHCTMHISQKIAEVGETSDLPSKLILKSKRAISLQTTHSMSGKIVVHISNGNSEHVAHICWEKNHT